MVGGARRSSGDLSGATVQRVNVENSINAARLHKQRLVRDQGVGTDIHPVMEVWRDDDLLGVVYLSPRDTPTRVAEIGATIRAFGATTVVFIMEAFYELGPTFRGGNMQQRFADGDKTVAESVMVNVLDCTGRHSGLAVLPYRYEGRKVRWLPPPAFDESVDSERHMGGDLPDGVMPHFAQSALLTDRTAALQEFEALGLELVDVPRVTPRRVDSIGRNARCPCGSGLKFKQCCINSN